MFDVVSESMRPSGIVAIASAATRMALMPFSGFTPACAARPWMVTSSESWAGARTMIVPGSPWASSPTPRRARSQPVSKDLAPSRPDSSPTVNSTSSGRCGVCPSRRLASTSRMMATPDLSSAPSTVEPSDQMTPSRTCGRTFSPGETVSMCAVRSRASSPTPSVVAKTLPAASRRGPSPSARKRSASARPIASSWPDGLDTRTRSRNVFRRRFSSIMGLLSR